MASSASSLLRVELQTAGENLADWGGRANGSFQRLEEAIAGTTTITTVGGTKTLTATNFSADEARSAILLVTSTLTSNLTIEAPASNKLYYVANRTSGAYTVTIKPVAGTGVVIPQGKSAFVRVSSTAAEFATPPVSTAGAYSITSGDVTGALGYTPLNAASNLSDIASASTARSSLGLGALATKSAVATADITDGNVTFAKLSDVATAAQYRANTASKVLTTDQVWSAAASAALTDAATIAVDMSAGFNFTVTLGGNRTLGAPTNQKVGQSGFIRIAQDGTGSRTLAFNSAWKFASGTAPSLTTTANKVDTLFYTVVASGEIWANLVKAGV